MTNNIAIPTLDRKDLTKRIEDDALPFLAGSRKSKPHTPPCMESLALPPQSRQAATDPADPSRPCFPPFRMDSEGLWFVPKGRSDDDGTEMAVKPQKIAGPFQILAEVRDSRASAWGLRLRWNDPDGMSHEETIPRELALGEGTELARILIRQGLWVAPDDLRRKKLVAYLASVRVDTRARSVQRIGWQGGAFVLPDEVFGEAAAGERVYLALDLEHNFRTRETLEKWQQEVGIHAQGNSRLTFALSCAFAPPLMGRLGMESGGFHLYGHSSKGKTTCVDVAGSVWGGPVYHETWRATSSGLEAIAMLHNDCLLVLDEQGQTLPSEAGEVAYLLANGTDKVRAKKTLDAHSRRHWLILILSTGEVTLADKMREAGRSPKAGQEVRLVDVPANPDGFDQAFERWDGFETSMALANHLQVATKRYYGTASRAFLTHLCQLSEADILDLERRKSAWTKSHLPRGADSQVGRVADRFALVYLAGELATEWGIAPWNTENVTWAVEACWRAWLLQRGGIRAGEHERGIAAVLGFVERHGTSRFATWNAHGERVANCAGFRRTDGHGRMDYLFHTEGWKDACEGLNPKDVARACAEVGLLDTMLESNVLRFQKNIRVPGVGTERYYIITGRGLEAFRLHQTETEL